MLRCLIDDTFPYVVTQIAIIAKKVVALLEVVACKRDITQKNFFLAIVASFWLITLILLLPQDVLVGAGCTSIEFRVIFIWFRHLSFKNRGHKHLNSYKFFDLLGGGPRLLASTRGTRKLSLISGGIIIEHYLRIYAHVKWRQFVVLKRWSDLDSLKFI